jgi:hypothetical protein
MLRCVEWLVIKPFALGLLACAALLPAATWAQNSTRSFPANALRGEIIITQPPELLLNRQAARLAPGARIRGMDNLMLMSGALSGQRLVVHFTLDSLGQLLDVWVLTPPEMARRPWPSTPLEAASWSFNADTQTWTRP